MRTTKIVNQLITTQYNMFSKGLWGLRAEYGTTKLGIYKEFYQFIKEYVRVSFFYLISIKILGKISSTMKN